MRKPYYIALSMALGIATSSLLGSIKPAIVLAQPANSGAGETSPAPSPKPKTVTPQSVVDAVGKLETAEKEFGRSLETYLFKLEAIATVNSLTDAGVSTSPKPPESDPPDYEDIRSKLNQVITTSKAISALPDLQSAAELKSKLSSLLSPLNKAATEMESRVLSPFSLPDQNTKLKGIDNKASVQELQKTLGELNVLDGSPTPDVYDTITHNGMKKFLNSKRDNLKTQVATIKREISVSSNSLPNELPRKPSPNWNQYLIPIATSVVTSLTILTLASLISKQLSRRSSEQNSEITRLESLMSNLLGEVDVLKKIEYSSQTKSSPSDLQEIKNIIDSRLEQFQAKINSSQNNISETNPRSHSGQSAGKNHVAIQDAHQESVTPISRSNLPKLTPIAIVTLAKEVLKDLWQAKDSVLILTENSEGIFQVSRDQFNKHYLLVFFKRLNQNNLNTLKHLYDFPPDSNISNQPEYEYYAEVTPIDGNWQLTKRGKLRFG